MFNDFCPFFSIDKLVFDLIYKRILYKTIKDPKQLYTCLYDIIMHVYIAPEQGNPVLRRCTILLSMTQTCFHPAHISTHEAADKACFH